MIVPATVPDAQVLRMKPAEPEGPVVISAEPAPVPPARPVRIVPEQITPEQVAMLRRENHALRGELARARAV
ncbi:MAG: hypothetical protein JWP11_766 [Frankiales bacterium]|jgi:hypothetical protein|nr:hypothetical protein [Frankiales bacterium]